MKKCFKCGVEKPLSEFYTHKRMADGHLGKCKDCTRSDSKKNMELNLTDPDWHEKEKERQREKYYRLEYREKHKPTTEEKKEITQRYESKYPEKRAARRKTNAPSGFHAHHWSYKKEHQKDIILLTKKDHYIVHRYIEYDIYTFMYNAMNGELLDTKEKHIEHIKNIFTLYGIDPYF